MIVRSPRLQPGKFVSRAAKRVLQHNRRKSGKDVLNQSFSHFDPSRTSGRSPFWGADQLSSISPARTRSRRSIRHSRSASLMPLLVHDCRVGNDAELTTLRCDKLMMLALRGFERPCAWSEAECGRRWTFKSEHPGT